VLWPAARALLNLGELAVAASALHEQCAQTDTGPLDEISPLLGDRDAHPLDRGLEAVRLAAHRLSQPHAACSLHTLRVFAELAVLTAKRAQGLARHASRLGRPADQTRYHHAADRAGAALTAWQEISALLQPLAALGTDGAAAARLAARVAEQIQMTTTAAAEGDVRQLRPALTVIRRAVLILPDLGETGAVTANRMLAGGAMQRRRPRGNRYTPFFADPDGLVIQRRYEHAQRVSRQTVAAHLVLTGRQPLPLRAAYLAQREPAPLPTPVPSKAAARPLGKPRPQPVRIETRGHLTRIRDPDHGTLETPTERFEAALARTKNTLKKILRRCDGLYLTGDEQITTLAALAAVHAPHEIPSKKTPATRTRPQQANPTGPPAAAPPAQPPMMDPGL
jgi:hypothetical protein